MRRYLALFFPRWPVQHLRREFPETREAPVALFERTQRGCHLRVCSGDANALGVRGGMPMAEARALAPQVLLYELNLAECEAALRELCLWSTRFSPVAALESSGPQAPFPQTLLLDITGCADVFGGEEKLLAQAVNGLKKQGCKVRAAIAPTLGAAWALAHYGALGAIVSDKPEHLKEMLAPIPLAGLRLPADVLDDFRPLGLHRMGDILRQPRASLPSRFGKELIDRLDQAFDDAQEVLVPLRPAPEFRVARAFEYPVRSSETLFHILERLVECLARELTNAQRGARHIECWLYHEIAAPVCAEIALHRCSHSRKHLWQLLRTRLEDVFRTPSGSSRRLRRRNTLSDSRKGRAIEVEESVEAVAIHVTASESLGAQQLPLFERARDASAGGELNLLLDRLVTRLGRAAVCRVRLEDEPLPERAFRFLALDEQARVTEAEAESLSAPRPLRLLAQPVQMEWPHALTCGGQRQAIRSVLGPERIESGWWRGDDTRRDYYIVEVESGARYWVYEDLHAQRWFLQGSFD